MLMSLPNISINLLQHNTMNSKRIKLKNIVLESLIKKSLANMMGLLVLMFISNTSYAVAEGELLLPDVPDGIVKLTTVEPERDVGYTVGDTLKRIITVEVKKPYVLVKTSVPIVGYERRYKGKVIGIDVSAIKLTESEQSDTNTYTIDVDYQVLTNNVVAKPAALPAEILHFKTIDAKGKAALVQFRVPSWNFRISPLAVFGSVKVEQDMSGLRGPLVKDVSQHKLQRNIAAAVLGLALLGLLYILGNRAWLPRMGAPFAKALRDMRKLPDSPEGLQQAVAKLHAALNKTANQSVFNGGIDEFISKKPAFSVVKTDLIAFFEVSRHAFFESTPNPDSQSHNLAWLKTFARRCRDCERGLLPDTGLASTKS